MSQHATAIVRLKSRKALPFFSRHPWVYASAIGSISGSPDVGAVVAVNSNEGQFIAYGLYNPASKIRIRLYSWDENLPLDGAFWKAKIDNAVALRTEIFTAENEQRACRLIFSEADGLSGLTVDRFGDFLSLQWTSAALETFREPILDALQQAMPSSGIWLRTERGIGELEGLLLDDGPIAGEDPPKDCTIEENGLKFQVDIRAGQKTGYYFDQRDNRAQLRKYAFGRVLDICTYSGSFALNAARSDRVESVVAVDSSASAIELAKRNAELNGLSDRIEFITGDAFDDLDGRVENGETFDTIVLDPPKMTRSRGGLNRALKGYIRINRAAMKLLSPGGILMTCSCSGHLSREDFEQVLLKASLDADCSVQILEQRGAGADHPVSANCLETNYLKCFIARVTPNAVAVDHDEDTKDDGTSTSETQG